MDFQYNNGVFADHYNINRTPLEASIARYEANVKRLEKVTHKHYDQGEKLTEAQKLKRTGEKKEALDFLKRERQKLAVMGQVQRGLEKYHEEGMKTVTGDKKTRTSTLNVLISEAHHPTSELEQYMRAEGIPKPTPYHTAHHICPGSGQYEQEKIFNARLHMHTMGIRINDPANGVYLLTKDSYTPHYTMPNSRGHLKYHTREYENLVSQRIINLQSGDLIKTNLQVIGRILQQNEPKSAFEKMRAV